MEPTLLAYAAGVIDSDGCITIRKRTGKPGKRHPKAYISYAPCVFVRQVETPAVELLLGAFGGTIRKHAPSTPGGRHLYQWTVTHKKAHAAAIALLPHLRIKKRQAEILCEFCTSVRKYGFRKPATWYVHKPGESLYSVAEAAHLKGVSEATVRQSVANKTVPVVRTGKRGSSHAPGVFIPARFWDSYTVSRQFRVLPAEYIAWRERLTAEIRSLNGPTRGVKSADRHPVR